MPMTLGQFARHLGSVAHVIIPEVLRRVAEEIGEDAVARSKAKLGTDGQAGIGPYQTWPPLEDSTIEEKTRLGYPTPAILLREGDLRESISYDVHATTSNLEVTLYSDSPYGPAHELGRLDGTIPPRPFMGPVFYEEGARYNQMLGEAALVAIAPGDSMVGGFGGEEVSATMGTKGTGGMITSGSSFWRSVRSMAQGMGAWKSLRGKR